MEDSHIHKPQVVKGQMSNDDNGRWWAVSSQLRLLIPQLLPLLPENAFRSGAAMKLTQSALSFGGP
jgi:hypothetical protein